VAYDPTIYEGAARHYRPGRPPYSPQLEGFLTRELGLDGAGRLLDVGCGPGILTVRLAHLFEEATGVDPDGDMLDEARRSARSAALANCRWVKGRAEELPGIAPGPFRLVTFGQSLHWTDEPLVVDTVYDMLELAGAMAIVVHTVKDRPKPASPGPPPIPHEEITAIVERYLGTARRAGQGLTPERHHRFEDVLVASRFGAPRQVFLPGDPTIVRDRQGVLSGYLSFSWSAPHLFGERVDDFARDVLELLSQRSGTGLFWDWPGDTEVLLARRSPT
jgi:SAM-dependent methyltransferase